VKRFSILSSIKQKIYILYYLLYLFTKIWLWSYYIFN